MTFLHMQPQLGSPSSITTRWPDWLRVDNASFDSQTWTSTLTPFQPMLPFHSRTRSPGNMKMPTYCSEALLCSTSRYVSARMLKRERQVKGRRKRTRYRVVGRMAIAWPSEVKWEEGKNEDESEEGRLKEHYRQAE